jgi:hypothetical protein
MLIIIYLLARDGEKDKARARTAIHSSGKLSARKKGSK